MNNPTLDQWKRGLAIAEHIAALEKELAAILHGGSSAPAAATAKPRRIARRGRKAKGKMSPEARGRIAAAQKARWAKIKTDTKAPKAAGSAKAKAPVKAKRSMSPEAKAKLAAAMKARWAAARAGKGPLPNAKS